MSEDALSRLLNESSKKLDYSLDEQYDLEEDSILNDLSLDATEKLLSKIEQVTLSEAPNKHEEPTDQEEPVEEVKEEKRGRGRPRKVVEEEVNEEVKVETPKSSIKLSFDSFVDSLALDLIGELKAIKYVAKNYSLEQTTFILEHIENIIKKGH